MKMIQRILTAGITCFLLTTSLMAQDSPKKVDLGLRLAPNFTGVTPDNTGYSNNGVRLTLNYGLTADFRLFQTDNYRFTSGFEVLNLGGKLKYPDVVMTDTIHAAVTEATYRLRYLNLPFAIKLKTSEIGYMKYYGLIGGEFGYAIRAKADYTRSFDNTTQLEENVTIDDDINNTRLAFVVGVGAERIISGDTRVQVGLQYSSALTNFLDGKTYLLDDNGETDISTGEGIPDRDLQTKLNYVMLNIAILF